MELVEAGLRVIAREGMHGASVRAIVAEAGVPLATFHYVFASRDEMIGEAYAYVAAPPVEGTVGAQTGIPADASPVDAVRALLTAWFDRFAEHPEYELAIMEIMAYCRRTPALSHLPEQVQERYLGVVSEAAEALRARFGGADAAPVHELATLVLHVTDGLTYCWLRTHDTDASHRYIDAVAPMLAAAVAGPAR